MYKCSKCGHKSRTFVAMAKHARKHGFVRKVKIKKTAAEQTSAAMHFCPHCGSRLNQ